MPRLKNQTDFKKKRKGRGSSNFRPLLIFLTTVLLIFGLLASFLLTRFSQDLRQQALGETYKGVTLGGSCGSGVPEGAYGCDSSNNRLVCGAGSWRSTGQLCKPPKIPKVSGTPTASPLEVVPEELVGSISNVCYCRNERGSNYVCRDQAVCCTEELYYFRADNEELCGAFVSDGRNDQPVTEEQQVGEEGTKLFAPDFVPELTWFEGVQVHPDVVDNLSGFINAAEEQGYSILLYSGYRS